MYRNGAGIVVTKKKTIENEYPIRLDNFEWDSLHLDISLVAHEKDYTTKCNAYNRGFLVILSEPGSTVNGKSAIIRGSSSQYTWIPIEPKLIQTSEALRSYSPNQRGCVFNNERQLKFFKIYTEENCVSECVAKYMESECGCVYFYMPSMQLYFVSMQSIIGMIFILQGMRIHKFVMQ